MVPSFDQTDQQQQLQQQQETTNGVDTGAVDISSPAPDLSIASSRHFSSSITSNPGHREPIRSFIHGSVREYLGKSIFIPNRDHCSGTVSCNK